jgi:hypothetical protein
LNGGRDFFGAMSPPSLKDLRRDAGRRAQCHPMKTLPRLLAMSALAIAVSHSLNNLLSSAKRWSKASIASNLSEIVARPWIASNNFSWIVGYVDRFHVSPMVGVAVIG